MVSSVDEVSGVLKNLLSEGGRVLKCSVLIKAIGLVPDEEA